MGWINEFALEQQGQKQAEPQGPERLGVTLEVSSGLNADQAARASRLAGEIGATDDLVLASPDDAEQVAMANKIRAYPSLTDWAGRSAVNAAMAREEPEALGGIFDGIKGAAGGVASFLPKTAGQISKFGWDATGFLWGGAELGADLLGWDWGQNWAGAQRRTAQEESRASGRFLGESLWNLPPELQGDITDHPEYLLSPTYWSYQGADALASMVPALMASALTGGTGGVAAASTGTAGRLIAGRAIPAGIVGGFQEGSSLYTDLSSEPGGDDRNAANLLAGADMTMGSGLLNSISFGKIFGSMPPGLRKKFLDIAETSATEGVTEWLENPMSALLGSLARGDSAQQTASNVWAAAKDLNVIPGAMIAGGGTRAVGVYIASRESQTFVNQQLAINAKVTASQLYQRSPEKMRELLDSAGEVMSQVVTIPRAQLSAEVQAALGVAEGTDRVVSVPLSELHARLTPEAFKETIPLAEPVEGQSLVTARRKMEQMLTASIGRAVAARDVERAVNATMGLEEARQGTEDLRSRLRADTEALRSAPAVEATPGEGLTPDTAADETATMFEGAEFANKPKTPVMEKRSKELNGTYSDGESFTVTYTIEDNSRGIHVSGPVDQAKRFVVRRTIADSSGTVTNILTEDGWGSGAGRDAIESFSTESEAAEWAAEDAKDIGVGRRSPEEATDAAASENSPTDPQDHGVAYADAQVVESFLQTVLESRPEDGESLRAELLDGLGLAPDVYAEAVANNGGLEIDLNNLSQVVSNPLWDGFIDTLEADPVEMTREMQADLESLPPAPAVLDRAGSDVTPETRADVVQSLKAVGRSAAQAMRETELLARFASIRARVTGEDPNQMIKDVFRFGREGQGGGVVYNQAAAHIPATDPRVEFRSGMQELAEVPIINGGNISGEIKFDQAKESAKQFSQQSFENADLGRAIKITNRGIAETLRHRPSQAELKAFESLPELLAKAQWVRVDPDVSARKNTAEKVLMLYAPLLIDGELYAARINIKEMPGGDLVYYGHALEKTEGLTGNMAFSEDAHMEQPTASTVNPGIRIIDLLENVKRKGSRLPDNMTSLYQNQGDALRGRAEFLDDGSINIIFTQAQDPSTAVHEFAHAFRELVARTMALPADQIVDQAAFDSLKEGWEAAESWLARFDDDAALKAEYDQYQKKAFSGRAFEELTADEKAAVKRTAQHEYFARGFEAYLMEGAAPTSGLKKIFSQMKQWLVKLYNEARSLNVELNDDVRMFFDRLLSTEEEMAMESWRAAAAPTLDQLEMMREVDPQAVADYEAAAVKGREEAEKQLVQARMAEREKMLRQWHREGRKFAKEDERTRRVEDIRQAGGISLGSLKALGRDKDGDSINALQTRFPSIVHKDGKVGLDEYAETLGLSGDELFHELMVTPTLVQMETAYVAEQEAEWAEYFDADLGITDAEIEAWEAEKNLWAKFMVSKGSKYVPRSSRGLKAAIEAQFDGLTVDEIKRRNSEDLRASLKAQARAARDGYKAGEEAGKKAGLMAGVREGTRAGRREAREEGRKELTQTKAEGRANVDWAVAETRAKALEQRQELALRLRQQATRQREIMKFENKARKIIKQKAATATKPGGILPNFHSHIKNILAAAGLGRPVAALESLADFVKTMQADGVPVDVPQSIIDGSLWTKIGAKGQPVGRTYKGLTMDEFYMLRDVIDSLAYLGRRAQQVRVDGVIQSEDATAGQLIAAIFENNLITPPEAAHDVQERRLATGALGRGKAAWKKWRRSTGLMPSTLKLQHLAFDLDGQELNGIAQKILYLQADKATNTEIMLQEKWMSQFKEIVEKTVGRKAYQKWAAERVYIAEYGETFSRSQIMAAALNTGNLQNLTALNNHALFKGLGPDALLGKLTGVEWDFIQLFWDFQDNEVFPEMDRLTRRTKGVPLRKVEAAPFTVVTADGQTKEMRGGYFPLVFDREGGDAPIAERRMKAEAIGAMPTLFTPGKVQASSTIERTGTNYKEMYPMLDMSVLFNSLNDNIIDLAYREVVADTWRILKRPDVKAAITGALGDDAWLQSKLWVSNLVNGGEKSGGKLEGWGKAANVIRRHVARAAMALKMSVILLQATGAFQSAQILGYGWTRRGFYSLYKNALVDFKAYKAMVDEMYEKSPQLKYRNAQSFDRDMAASMISSGDPLYKQGLERATEIFFKPIGFTDQLIANGVWLGAYQKSLSEGKGESQAIQDADATLSLTQATARNKDMSYAQQGWSLGEAGKLLTMFQTFFSSTRNLQWLAMRQSARDRRAGNYGAAIGGPAVAALNLLILQSFFNALMWEGLPDDDEDLDEWAGDLALGTVAGSISSGFSGLPGLRDIMNATVAEVFGEYRPPIAISPIEGAFNNAFSAKDAAADMVKEGPSFGKAATLARNAGLLGVPGTSQLATTLEGIDEWDENDGLGKFYRLLIRKPN